MTAIIIFGILLLISLIGLGALVFRKLPQMRLVEPENISGHKEKRKKQDILRKRIERAGGSVFAKLNKNIAAPVGSSVQNTFRRFAGRLTALERRMQDRKRRQEHVVNPEALREQLQEAEISMKKEEFEKAEKQLIAVIGIDPKSVDAYEMLGALYNKRKEYDLAEETFRFLLKLDSDNASVNAYLGEVLQQQGKWQEAFAQYKKASNISTKNPKYLDFYITSAIELDKFDEARDALARLRAVNPENSKIDVFEKKLAG